MGDSKFLVRRGGRQAGPYTWQQIRAAVENGKLFADDEISPEHTEQWQYAKDIASLGLSSEPSSPLRVAKALSTPRPTAAAGPPKLPQSVESQQSSESPKIVVESAKKTTDRFSLFAMIGKGAKIYKGVAAVVLVVADVLTPIGPAVAMLLGASAVGSSVLGVAVRKKTQAKQYDPERMFPEQLFVFASVLTLISAIWFTLTLIMGDSEKGVVASNVPGVAKLQTSMLNLEEKIDDIDKTTKETRENTEIIKKDNKQIKKNTAATKKTVAKVAKDTEIVKKEVKRTAEKTVEIKEDTGEIKEDTTFIKTQTADIKEDTDDLKVTAGDILRKTGEIQEQLGNADKGGIIKNPETPAEFYHNARFHELEGKFDKAFEAYGRYMESNQEFIDPCLSYLNLYQTQKGAVRTEEYFGRLRTKYPDNRALQLVSLTLLASKNKRPALRKFIKANPDFGPGYLFAADSFSAQELPSQSSVAAAKEQEYLKQFVEADERGEVQEFYVDKNLAFEAVADAEGRLNVGENIGKEFALSMLTGGLDRFNIKDPQVRSVFYRFEGQEWIELPETALQKWDSPVGASFTAVKLPEDELRKYRAEQLAKNADAKTSLYVRYIDNEGMESQIASKGPFSVKQILEWQINDEKKRQERQKKSDAIIQDMEEELGRFKKMKIPRFGR